MALNLVQLTRELIDIRSVSRWSNADISDRLEQRMRESGFEVERLEYRDENGERKASLVAKKGSGPGGLAFISHTDTVPGQEQDWAAFESVVQDGRILGRGSCDMKGPLAATLVAAAADEKALSRPVFVLATADEEVGGQGAQQVVRESALFNGERPRFGVIAEPTQLVPVYAHKGGAGVLVTAQGKAAHTSTDRGVSANFVLAPFLAEMAHLSRQVKKDPRFINPDFTPPTNGFNMVVNDGGTRPNVTAPKATAYVGFRPAPGDQSEALVRTIVGKAEKHGLRAESHISAPFYVSPESELVRLASQVAGHRPQTAPYGTDAIWFRDVLELVVLGPGDIRQAHTVGESISVEGLEQAVSVYGRLIKQICGNSNDSPP